jgi:hypothetical protein
MRGKSARTGKGPEDVGRKKDIRFLENEYNECIHDKIAVACDGKYSFFKVRGDTRMIKHMF